MGMDELGRPDVTGVSAQALPVDRRPIDLGRALQFQQLRDELRGPIARLAVVSPISIGELHESWILLDQMAYLRFDARAVAGKDRRRPPNVGVVHQALDT